MSTDSPIFVTRPYLPPLEEFIPYLEQIWTTRLLTNGGPFHQQLETALCEYLGVEYLSLFTNGTLALVTALQALRITGEVITTPYSFVATAHSLMWNGIKPVFVDIDPVTLNLDPEQIEAAITPQTRAILPVHVYGTPCDVKRIDEIAQRNELKVIYDAAHAFGATDTGGSVLRHGDLSVLSFHATKVFNTFEGGAIVCHDLQTKQHIDDLKNFGFVNETEVVAPGINGKMSEVQSAMGLLQIKHMPRVIDKRAQVDNWYRKGLSGVLGIDCVAIPAGIQRNFSYFPILIQPPYAASRDDLYLKLKEHGIHTRRYFYPLISAFPMYREFPSSSESHLPIATDIANKVLCLPIYPELNLSTVERIVGCIRSLGT